MYRLVAATLLAAVTATVVALASGYSYTRFDNVTPLGIAASESDPNLPGRLSTLRLRERQLEAAVSRTTPSGDYVVIDRTHNKLYLRRGRDVVLVAICSAGSGATLVDPNGRREWTFATPRGRFTVMAKREAPVWRKPDWAFVEEGRPVPADPRERLEYGSLGEYALDLGDGYMIHGTLYEKLLGRSVSHGCVRLGRDALRQVYAATRVGSPVYVF
jgi:L,D-transpeptidase YbiS